MATKLHNILQPPPHPFTWLVMGLGKEEKGICHAIHYATHVTYHPVLYIEESNHNARPHHLYPLALGKCYFTKGLDNSTIHIFQGKLLFMLSL